MVDDLGLRPLTGQEPLDLYGIIRQRYEKRPLVITANRDIDELTRPGRDFARVSPACDSGCAHALQNSPW